MMVYLISIALAVLTGMIDMLTSPTTPNLPSVRHFFFCNKIEITSDNQLSTSYDEPHNLCRNRRPSHRSYPQASFLRLLQVGNRTFLPLYYWG